MLKSWKKWLFSGVLVSSVVAMAACGNNTNSEKANSNASSFPEKKVEIIVPFGAGDTMDLAAHALSKEFESITGQTLVVNNQPGGAGVPGTMKLVKADPDGYTIAMIPSGQLAVRPLTQEVNYTFDDFTPIIGVGDFQMHPVAATDAPYNTVAEMVEYYKKSGETLKVGTPGVNTYSHIFAELLKKETGINYNHLPFEGGPAVVAQILGGHVDIGVVNVSNVYQDVQAGKLKILGFPTEERYSNFPDIPTIKEQGINIVGGPTFGIYGPANLPADVTEVLNKAFAQAMDSDSFKEFIKKNNILLTKTEPTAMMDQIKAETEKIKEVLK